MVETRKFIMIPVKYLPRLSQTCRHQLRYILERIDALRLDDIRKKEKHG